MNHYVCRVVEWCSTADLVELNQQTQYPSQPTCVKKGLSKTTRCISFNKHRIYDQTLSQPLISDVNSIVRQVLFPFFHVKSYRFEISMTSTTETQRQYK